MLDIKNINDMKRLFLSMLIACAAWVAGMAQVNYTIEVFPALYGAVTSDKATAAQGETVTLTLLPDPFYALQQLTVESELIGTGMSDDDAWEPALAPANIMVPTNKVSENIYTFVMPPSNVKVVGIFSFAAERPGDVNHDGAIDVEDVVALINFVLGNESVICATCGDVNGSGNIDVEDVTALIDIILGNSANQNAAGAS